MKHEAIVANHREALRKNIALTLIQVPAEFLQKSDEDELEKGGVGSGRKKKNIGIDSEEHHHNELLKLQKTKEYKQYLKENEYDKDDVEPENWHEDSKTYDKDHITHKLVLHHNALTKLSEEGDLEKAEYFTAENILKFSEDLQKSFDSGEINQEEFEKAVKDLTKLQKRVITNKDGFQQTVYVRVHDDKTEHHFTHGDSVKFEHHGKSLTGTIKGLKSHEKYDKFGTAEIHDDKGNKYSKSLRQIEHHVTPVEFDKTEGDEGGNVKGKDIEGGGEKLIGKTKSGKGIYDSFDSEKHNNFTKEDHQDAGSKHYGLHLENEKEAKKWGKRQLSAKRSEQIEYFDKLSKRHSAESKKHFNVGETKERAGYTATHYDENGNAVEDKGVILHNEPKTKETLKMSGVDAINYKQDQLKALEAKIKNHDTGVKKMEEDELTNAKTKIKLLKLVIKNLATKSGIDLSKSNK